MFRVSGSSPRTAPPHPPHLRQHEWQKHGTCSGLNQHDYFRLALQAFSLFPTADIIQLNVGGSVDMRSLAAAYNATGCSSGSSCNAAVQCDKSNGQQYFAAVVTCWSKSLRQMTCPGSVISKVCSSGPVGIRGF